MKKKVILKKKQSQNLQQIAPNAAQPLSDSLQSSRSDEQWKLKLTKQDASNLSESRQTPIPFEELAKNHSKVEPSKRPVGRPRKQVASDAATNSAPMSSSTLSGSATPFETNQAQGAKIGAANALLPVSSGIPKKWLADGWKVPAAILAAKYDDKRLAISQEEADILADSLDPVLAKYLPNLTQQYGVEFALGMSIIMVFGPRALIIFTEHMKKSPAAPSDISK